MKRIKWYMAGPMSGIAQFNIPAFDAAALDLRAQGYTIVSPAERDTWETRKSALASETGDQADLEGPEGWGDMLSRDVKIISDEVQGIVFLPGWSRSKGARLEAYIGLLAGCRFALYYRDGLLSISRGGVKQDVAKAVMEL